MKRDTKSAPISAGKRLAETPRRRPLKCVAWALLLGACAQPPAPVPTPPEAVSIEQRLQNLEWRFDTLERFITNLPSPPLRSREEIERNVRSLESERAALMTRYTGAHPLVREVDLSLRLLRLQLEMLDQGGKRAK